MTRSMLLATSVHKSASIELLEPEQFFHLHFSPIQRVHCPLQVSCQVSGSLLLCLPSLSVLADSLYVMWGTGRLAVKRYLDGARNCTGRRSIRFTYSTLSVACHLCHLWQLALGWLDVFGERFEGIVGFLAVTWFYVPLSCAALFFYSLLWLLVTSSRLLCVRYGTARASSLQCFFPPSFRLLLHEFRTFEIHGWIFFCGVPGISSVIISRTLI